MYSRQEASQLRQEFWTTFGQYMSPVLSSEGEKVNWVNYKTGEKDIYFRMYADNKKVSIGIELTHKDIQIQHLYFEQFKELKQIMSGILGEEWTWLLHTHDENGKMISKIYTEEKNVSIFDKNSWPALISFLKPRIIALDEFWNNVKYAFEALR
ncbi:MAG TPA: DUF4268 domain-containing protein [Flavisolibacter sp.]|nr:DUF4268 domain-containing protein [Flavisolibacter sp.]